jgi:AhpD family alkylhydroperoxidase
MSAPRISPGSPADLGPLNALIARALGRASGTNGPPNLFATLGRHRRLFVPWLMFAGRLMPGGSLPRADTELVILRVAHNCGCEYEWRHHERLGQAVGMSADDVARVRTWRSKSDGGFDAHQAALLRAADEMHQHREISDELWATLSAELSPRKLIELCMLIGHYEMLAMTINTLRIEPDTFDGEGGQATSPLAGRRVLITGAARGIGAAGGRGRDRTGSARGGGRRVRRRTRRAVRRALTGGGRCRRGGGG